MKPFKLQALSLCLIALPLSVLAQDVNAEREKWALHARGGENQLAESIDALNKLYAQSKDAKVRADLIALLVRQGNGNEALRVCDNCKIDHYSLDELQNLAKAARDNKQFGQAQEFYSALQQQGPSLKIGFLGGALTAVDAHDYAAAKNQIAEYQRRFGSDEDIQFAERYMGEQSQSLTERLTGLQQQLSANPDNKELVLQVYRTAAQLRAFPIQEELVAKYPNYFSDSDRLWLKEGMAVNQYRLARTTGDKAGLQSAYDALSEVVNQSAEGSALNTQALRDRMAVAVALEKGKLALADYNTLARRGTQPDYVQEQYAEALAINGDPVTVRKVYEGIASRQRTADGKLPADLTEKLVQANADTGNYTQAQNLLNNWNPNKYTNDFTRTSQVDNPYYDKQYFWNARLEAWNGNIKGAIKIMDNWLADYPGDPWAMALRGDLAQWNGREDEALSWYEQAKQQLPNDSQAWLDRSIGGILSEKGNWAGLEEMAAKIDRNDPEYQGFWKMYDEAHAAQFQASYGITHATSPRDSGNEWEQSTTLYSPRSKGGHRAYIHQQSGYVPNHGDPLRHGRIGAGGEFSLYPITLNVEAGQGTHLNEKAYFGAGLNWRVNEQFSLNARAEKNSANTPTKALSQDVYANEYSLSANYNPSGNTRTGFGASIMTFDDDNVRKSVYGWVSQLLFQHNRWKLDSSLWADYSNNKDTPSAYYYNPKNSRSLSGNLDLSYFNLLPNGMRLTHHINGGLGRYWQAEHSSENTWMLKYGHDWNLTKNIGLAYEFGRKQAIYDGNPEFHNFGNVNLNVRFR
ncbi:MAG: poly-beta-1,6 N-acetyl-D-glucosamine export porin PgaA [Neisseria sp.]|uniref:poly-beta-1,6 N-acetyl-D-glucosamine export porin PgaA n=1 Tax=Neisseria sp. TaxID=192066 RepID=UPI0026DAE439|nr:poly-beta-1,6 N-acetyl-D-glucosamine export porin PgaA [Neisseria sp.]MDO4247542.1 poly-beta-1,6 N-acetyl-D-glucosamine export porin PgaA [Neisseria sp.]